MLGAVFDETDLRNSNFKTAKNFTINLESNKLQKAVFSKDNVATLLEKYQIKVEWFLV